MPIAIASTTKALRVRSSRRSRNGLRPVGRQRTASRPASGRHPRHPGRAGRPQLERAADSRRVVLVRRHHDRGARAPSARAAAPGPRRAVCESRLPVGSSAITSGGSLASARAIAARCCWPPESAAGSLSAWSAIPTRSSSSSARGGALRGGTRACEVHRQHDVLGRRSASAAAGRTGTRSRPSFRASAASCVLGGRVNRTCPPRHLAGARPVDARRSGGAGSTCPLPDLPRDATNSPLPI